MSPGAGVLRRPTFGGAAVGLLAWWASLTPTLIPRTWLVQALVSGTCLALGYAIGTLVGRGVHWSLRRSGHPGTTGWPTARVRAWIALIAAWPVILAVGAVQWWHWQDDQAAFMQMDRPARFDSAPMVLASVPLAVLLVVLGRAIGVGLAALDRRTARYVPRLMSVTIVAVVVFLAVTVAAGAVFRGITALASSTYAAMNDETTEGVVPPTSAEVSGSSESLVDWDSLGRTGRDFAGEVTTPAELEEFHGPDAALTAPVRVYVGVLSADTLSARADLAVRELVRAGGFDRKVLAVWVPTGSGWMISEAATALEQLYRGDTAIVGLQYSYLPSLLSVFLDPGLAVEAGTILFDAVEKYWLTLPSDTRPKLVLFGKSLGTAGVEAPFAAADPTSSLANLVARTDGALIVGAKHGNPIMAGLTRDRDAGSPVWEPVFDGGETVRFLTRDPDREDLTAAWPEPRVVYLQHPSDPVSYWGPRALWWPPEWYHRPRGYDVPDSAHWFPVISGVQAVADLINQLSPPPGVGHDYSNDYVTGWAQLVPPDGWTDADTDRLTTFLHVTGDGESEP
jgi:uncharacterized membrane protein